MILRSEKKVEYPQPLVTTLCSVSMNFTALGTSYK